MKILRQIAILLLLLGSLAAQKTPGPAPLPAELPPAGPLKPVVSPPVVQRRLANGMSVWMVERADLPKVVFVLTARGGDSLDPASSPGLARLMARAMTQGTTSQSSRQIAEAAQATGGDLSATANADATEVTLDVLSEHAGDAVALLADIAQNANFPENEVALAKSNMEDQLRANEATPRFLARRAWYQITYGDHPYSIVFPTMKTLEQATPESLRSLYAQNLRPDQALLVVVGSFDQAELAAQIEKAFGAWKSGVAATALVREPAAKAEHKIYLLDRPGSVQTTMLIGGIAPTLRDPDEPYLMLANTIYAGSFASRLTRNIREDKGYTYSPFSFLTNFRWSATILTSEDVRNQVTGPSLKETFYELNRISTEAPSAAELDSARRYLIGNTALDVQSRGSLATLLGKYWVNNLPADHLTAEMTALQKADVSQVGKAAARYLAPDRMSVVAVGEKSVMQEQFKPFGLAMVPAPQP